jgi:hypothetical protein
MAHLAETTMTEPVCRACLGRAGQVVLDLGEQPACDHFPSAADAGPDPTYPLQLWLCSSCGLAQLAADPTVPDEPKATEPAALVAQAEDAVDRVVAAGWLPAGGRVAEYSSPHGGSWLGLLHERGLALAGADEPADVVLDCFGMMHVSDQAAAVAQRAARVAPGGVLLLQYHSLATIIERAQWNAVRHGHFAYYSTTALSGMLAATGFAPRSAWEFELYGGTVLLAATRATQADRPDASVAEILAAERRLGATDPHVLGALQREAVTQAGTLHDWLASRRASGRSVLGYGAASRAVSLLCRAGIGSGLLPAVADASLAKQGSRMPGTDIPVVDPAELVAAAPDDVLLMLPDLLAEVRRTLPGVEAAGGRWVNVEELLSGQLNRSVVEGVGSSADQGS